jgi:hypothetical protein
MVGGQNGSVAFDSFRQFRDSDAKMPNKFWAGRDVKEQVEAANVDIVCLSIYYYIAIQFSSPIFLSSFVACSGRTPTIARANSEFESRSIVYY